jgi:hypothetical protein
MKRFTETTKWDDPWFRKLPAKLKCLWQYMCDRCDGAGVIDLDYELAGFQIGAKLNEQDVLGLGDRVEKLECGKWWVRQFVAFQYGKLSEDCKAHGPVFTSLAAYGLTDRVSKGYPKGIHTLKDKERDKEEVQETETDKATRTREPEVEGEGVLLPKSVNTPELRQAWKDYTDYRKERRFKTLAASSIRAQFETFAKWGAPAAIDRIRETIRNGWQGIFEPKHGTNGGVPPSVAAARDGRHYPGPQRANIITIPDEV